MKQHKANEGSYALVMVTYNRGALLTRILESIKSYRWGYQEFVIVDNNSADSTAQMLSAFSSQDRVSVLTSSANIGHGAGLALAFKHIQKLSLLPEFVVFLEDDSIPDADLISFLLQRIKNSGYDLLSPAGNKVRLGKRENIRPGADEIVKADFCLFDGAILKYEVIVRVGYPMEDWFMMVDDYEYCTRMRRHGFKLGVIANPYHEIMHLGGVGGFTRSTLWRGYYQIRNHVFFLKKHFSLFHLFDFILLQGKRTLASATPPDRIFRVRLRLIGLWHGIKGKKGRTLNPETLQF